MELFPVHSRLFYLLMLMELRTAVITPLIHGVMSVTGIFTKNAGEFALYQKVVLNKNNICQFIIIMYLCLISLMIIKYQ